MATFYGYTVVCDCDCGSENTEFIPDSDEYSSYGNSERFKCMECGNEFKIYTP
ncbi:hypothetical protein REC12_20520 [Desulfosporosinus sp. PR]|uniref:hypothetical protein n=1 Tax=Candidatus Desulfosporosinus nitrosoreducens TaxID=3401928 RepID=UPI0027EB96DC|nr:hypothetical protein [Desulfosporosinus sp. PR]MDQ7095983.1 hypothetical protein [Desulfosporosinus sp. PR]